MRYSESEIVEDIFEHIRQLGGEFDDSQVGTAKEPQSPGFVQQLAGGLREEFLYREACTTSAADEVLDRLKGCGLRLDRPAVPDSGRIVFVYHLTANEKAAGPGAPGGAGSRGAMNRWGGSPGLARERQGHS